MKIKIAYEDYEKRQARTLAALIRKELEPDSFVTEKHSEKHKPHFHIYLSSRNYRISGK